MGKITEIRPPLVGREEEMEALLSHLGRALKGEPRFILIVGEAGVGKTRLAEELESHARKLGFTVVIGKCMPGSGIPNLPISEALGLHSHPTPSIQSTDDGRLASEKFLFQVLEEVNEICSENPLLIRLEDLHWVDSKTMPIVHFLLRNAKLNRLIIIGTARSEELGGEGGIHPLTETMRQMKREEIAFELPLSPLDKEDLEMAVRGSLSAPIDDATSSVIAEESEGNPLYAVELLRFLILSGEMQEIGGRWISSPSGMQKLPPTIKDLVMGRIAKLTREQRRLLEQAAVMGDRFDYEILNDITGKQPLMTLEYLDELGNYQFITHSAAEYQFTHARIREVLYDEISGARRTELHRLVAGSLEKRSLNDQIVLELARHYYLAKVREKCIQYSVMAGEIYLGRYAIPESIPFFERVYNATKGRDNEIGPYLRAVEGLGTAQSELSNYKTSWSFFDEFLQQNKDREAKARVIRKATELWMPTRLGQGDPSKAAEMIDESLSIIEVAPTEKGELLSLRMFLNIWNSEFEIAESLCTQSEAMFEQSSAYERLGLQLAYHMIPLISEGRLDDAFDVGRRALELFRTHPYPSGELEVLSYMGVAALHQGRVEDARKHLEESIELASKLADQVVICWGHIYLGLLYEVVGDRNDELKEARKARELATSTESTYMLIAANSLLAIALVRSAMIEEADQVLKEAESIASNYDWRIRTIVRGFLSLARAEVARGHGQKVDSADAYSEAVEQFHRTSLGMLWEGLSLERWAEALAEMERKDEAMDLRHRAISIFNVVSNELMLNLSTR